MTKKTFEFENGNRKLTRHAHPLSQIPMKLFFITGTSRGIGEALAQTLLSPGHLIHCFSRSGNPGLQTAARIAGCTLYDHRIDLSDIAAVEALFKNLFAALSPEAVSEISLIHNAALLEPVLAVGKGSTAAQIERLYRLNVVAPMLINELLLQRTQSWPLTRRILLISSGAAKRATHAWAAYCSSKAAIDMYAACLALEQSAEPHPVAVLALAPGVVETAMQETLRSKSIETFPLLPRFLQIRKEGKAFSPAFVAQHIAALLAQPVFPGPVVQDLRDIVGMDQK